MGRELEISIEKGFFTKDQKIIDEIISKNENFYEVVQILENNSGNSLFFTISEISYNKVDQINEGFLLDNNRQSEIFLLKKYEKPSLQEIKEMVKNNLDQIEDISKDDIKYFTKILLKNEVKYGKYILKTWA
uniref:Uncharacterized protein n=1 Tax=viral metagenome TaxID=1070528 RepID=A0A6C0AE10_9ZZZZ